eukprot:SAG31_NODE_2384_length_5820_cov_7.105732_5_plen_90_part_00
MEKLRLARLIDSGERYSVYAPGVLSSVEYAAEDVGVGRDARSAATEVLPPTPDDCVPLLLLKLRCTAWTLRGGSGCQRLGAAGDAGGGW